MVFRAVEKRSNGGQSIPQLTIYSDGNGRLTAAADKLLGTPAAVRILVGDGEDYGWLALEGSDDEHAHYTIARDDDRSAGGDVTLKTTLRDDVGVDVDSLDGSHSLPVEQEGEMLLVDLREHPAIDIDATDAAVDAGPDGNSEEEVTEASDADVQRAVDGDEPSTNGTGPAHTPTTADGVDIEGDGTPPWRQGERDRRERVQLYVAAMVNELGSLKSTYADIAEQVGHPDAHGNTIRHDLEAMDGYEATEYEDPKDGPTVWRIAETGDMPDPATNGQAATQDDDQDLLEAVIVAEGDEGPVEIPADEAVDAIANAEDVHDVQVALGLDRVGVRLLLQEVDMLTMLTSGDGGLHQDTVRETIAGYLEVQDA